MEGAYGRWDDWLPMVQISLNQVLNKRTDLTAFGLMFNWPFNGLGDFHDVANEEALDSVMKKQQKAWVLFRDAVLPGLKSRVADVKREQQMKINAKKQVESLLPGDVDITRESKWEPIYEGPYSILHQHKSGTYSLLDAMGNSTEKSTKISN